MFYVIFYQIYNIKKEYFLKKKLKYNLHSLNITLNIGEYFEKYIEQQYEELQFEYILEYVKIYENYIQNYFNNIIINFNYNKNSILNKFSSLTNNFLKKFKEGVSNFVNNEFIEEIKNNYSNCLGYSMDLLNETIEEDNINYEKYLNYSNIMEYINSNCSTDDIRTEEIEDCLYNISEIEEVTFYNKTEHLLFCHKNNYFNYSIKMFDNFEDKYKNKLDELINKILVTIEKNNLDITFINSFMTNEFKLKPYDLTENDLLGDLEGYEDMTIYINYTYNSYYQDYLKGLLIDSFQVSYINYINNYLIEHLKENINIYISTKLDFYTEYLTEKISNEFDYYVFLFNKTKEIGIGTQNAFSKLYKNSVYKNLKFYYEIIEEDVLFYINLFYRKNKYLFKENYINYFFNELNEYNIELYGLKEFIDEIIYDQNFNKSLNNYSNILMKDLIFEKLNETFNNNYKDKMTQIDVIINNYNNKIIEILAKINKNEDNYNINKIIMNYQEILLNQNNKFIFRVSNEPFDLLNNFIKNILEPPLIRIKNQYNLIENEILGTISDSVENFPDYISIIKNMLYINEIFNHIASLYDIIKDLLIKYGDDLDNDINTYINKLIHFTYINGLYTYDKPCNYSFCKINMDNDKTIRNLEENNFKYFKIRKLSESGNRRYENLKINKKIYLNGLNYNEEMGALSKDDIIYLLKETRNAINQLNRTFQINFDVKVKTKLKKYLIKINGTHLVKLKKTISISALKFSSFLTKESYKILENKMFKHYYLLENYIFNYSNHLENNTYNLINTIKYSSVYFKNINNYIYDKILGIYEMFIKIIENKYSRISTEEYKRYKSFINKRRLNKRNLDNKNDKDDDDNDEDDVDLDLDSNLETFGELFEAIRIENENIKDKVFAVAYQFKFSIFGKVIKDFTKVNGNEVKIDDNEEDEEDGFDLNIDITLTLKNFKFPKMEDIINLEKCNSLLELKFIIIIYLPSFPYLQFRINPGIDIEACNQIGYELESEKNKNETFYLVLDFSLKAIASVNLEIGLYYPPFPTGFEMSLAIGMQGILGSGEIGVKFKLDILYEKTKLIKYYEYQAIQIYFYILFKIEIKAGFFNFSFQFYLLKENIFSACKKCVGKKEEE